MSTPCGTRVIVELGLLGIISTSSVCVQNTAGVTIEAALPFTLLFHGVQALSAEEGGDEVTLAFSEEDRPGYLAAVDARMALAEVGWLKFPKLMHMGWAAQRLLDEAITGELFFCFQCHQ